MAVRRFAMNGALLLALCVCLWEYTWSEKCDRWSPVLFPQVLVMMSHGPGPLTANATMISSSLGTCGSLDTHTDKMINHFRSWGLDLSSRRRFVFQLYENDEIILHPSVSNPESGSVITVKSVLGYAEIINAPVDYTMWSVIAKTVFRGRRGTFPQGLAMNYGILRFNYKNEDFCIEFYVRKPKALALHAPMAEIELVLNHEKWGEGEARGLRVNDERNPGSAKIRFVMTFSGNNI